MTAPVETIAGWELWRDKDGLLRAEYPDGDVIAFIDDGALRVSFGHDDSRCAVIVPVALAERLIADARDRGILPVLAIVAAKDVRPDEPRLWLRTSSPAQLDRITPADLHTERRLDDEPWAAVVATARLAAKGAAR